MSGSRVPTPTRRPGRSVPSTRSARPPSALLLVAAAVAALAALVACAAEDPRAGSPVRYTAAPTGGSAPALDLPAVPPCPVVPRVAPRPDGLPPLTLPCLGDGPAVRLSDLRGTPMVVNVWAAWCTECAAEMPHLAAVHRRLGDRVRFFGVHYKAARRFGLSAAPDLGVFFPSVQDTAGTRTVKALRATAPPQTFFVTADGRVVEHTLGAVASEAELAGLVERYLGVRA